MQLTDACTYPFFHEVRPKLIISEASCEITIITKLNVSASVDDDAEASKEGDFSLLDAHTAAAPDHGAGGRQCRGAEGQHPNLLQVVRHVGVHGDAVHLVAAFAKLGLGSNHVGNVQVVALGHRTGNTSERLVGLVRPLGAGLVVVTFPY